MCTFASFVDFPFLFLEGFLRRRFFTFFNFNLCTGCQNVFLSSLVGLDTFLVELARTEVSSEETVPSIYQGST